MRLVASRAGFAPALTLLCALALPAVAAAAEFLPHRAVYALSRGTRTSQAVTQVTGTMSIELDESCEGWSLSQRIRMAVTDSMGSDIESDSRYASFETADGTSLRFSASDWQDGNLVEETMGSAERPAPGSPGKATFVKPQKETFDIPGGALFPAAFNLELLKRSAAGEGYHTLTGFDGGNLEGAYAISVFIGKTRDSEAKLPAGLAPELAELLAGQVRGVRVAYFPVSSQAAEPELEYEMELLPNGVSPQLRLDYQRYQVRAQLTEFKALARPRCAH
ncbi:MAG: DUF1849 family protein [Alphaproteobacteria bacterium]|nr:DUF1849 family protein [Alphaproteobacteria bacterium]